MGSSERRLNPHPVTSDSQRNAAWFNGYDAAKYNANIEKEESKEETDFEHGDCEDCTHQIHRQVMVKILFELEYVGDEPTSHMIAMTLADTLPREWWANHREDDWGVVTIMPLDSDGNLVRKRD